MSDEPKGQMQTPAQPGNLSETGKAILARAGVDHQQQPQGQEPVAETALPKELEVDMGNGVKRRVPVEELGKTYAAREQTELSKREVKALLAEMGDLQSVRALQERIASLDPANRSKVLALLQGQAERVDADEGDDIVREALGDDARSGRSPMQAPGDDRIARLERGFAALAQRETGRYVQERTQSVASQVDELMGQFPVFKDNAGATKFAKNAILKTVAANPNVDRSTIEREVIEAASQLQEVVTSQLRAQREEIGVPATMRPKDRAALTGDGLRKGLVRDLAASLLRSRSG